VSRRRNRDFDDCKGPYRHAWFDHDGSGFKRPPFGRAFHTRCFRCETVRRDVVSNVDGRLLSRRYYYPEGYKYAKGEKPSTEQLRLHALKTQKRNLKETRDMPRTET
jgi:hypothetical protein